MKMDNDLETWVKQPRTSFRVRRQMEALWGVMKGPFEECSPSELETRRIVSYSSHVYERIRGKVVQFPSPSYRQS